MIARKKKEMKISFCSMTCTFSQKGIMQKSNAKNGGKKINNYVNKTQMKSILFAT